MQVSDFGNDLLPRWIDSPFTITPGRDPLGLQSITTDGVMPILVPGILALSRRARYFSFYPFLIEELARHDKYATQQELSRFIKLREYELALAVHLCPNCRGTATGAIGTDNARAKVNRGDTSFERSESVKSDLGGYGQNYRTPLESLGAVARQGEQVGTAGEVLPREYVRPGTGLQLAEHYRAAIADTEYFQNYFHGTQAIPRTVLEEFSRKGCLCQLEKFAPEQKIIFDAILGPLSDRQPDTARETEYESEPEQRRSSFALMYWALGNSDVDRVFSSPEEEFRYRVWKEDNDRISEETRFSRTLAKWAALAARDYLQEGFEAIFSDLVALGWQKQPVDGMTSGELELFLSSTMVQSAPLQIGDQILSPDPSMPTKQLDQSVADAATSMSLEELRGLVSQQNSAVSGLALLLVLNQQLTEELMKRKSWQRIASTKSSWHPGVLGFVERLRSHLDEDPTLGETMSWLCKRFVIDVHERNAYSKFPNYTFRFRWEENRLRFYHQNRGHVSMPDFRIDSVSRIGLDLGLVREDADRLILTQTGDDFVREVFG